MILRECETLSIARFCYNILITDLQVSVQTRLLLKPSATYTQKSAPYSALGSSYNLSCLQVAASPAQDLKSRDNTQHCTDTAPV